MKDKVKTVDQADQKNEKKKKAKVLPVTVIVMIAVAALSGFLLYRQYRKYEQGVLDVCAAQQDGYVQLVLDQINLNSKRSDAEIIKDIIGTLDSSSSRYWTFSKGEQLLFVKDVLETNKYRSLTVDSYYGNPGAVKFINSLQKGKVSHSQVTVNGSRYMASGARFTYNKNTYRLVLMTNDAVILDNNNYLGAKTEMATLFGAVLILLMLIPMAFAWHYDRLGKIERGKEAELKKLNGVIERSGPELIAAKEAGLSKAENADAAVPLAGHHEQETTAAGGVKNWRYYELKFYLNASHYIIINGEKGEEHPHTWEFTLDFSLPREPFVEFGTVEKKIQKYLKPYQNQVLNEKKPFDAILPTVENITDFFAGEFAGILAGFSGRLNRVKASETPTRTYVVICGTDREG